MKKVMRKVKSQWIVVGLSVLAMSGVCVAASGDDSVKKSPDILKRSIETTPINQTNGYDWVANNVNEIESEISAQKSANQEEYVIQWGDTLFGISKATGIPISELVLLNGITNPDLIYTGDLLHGILSKHYENQEQKVTEDSKILISGKLLSDKKLETAKIVTFQTITQYDNTLPAGERHVRQEGVNGYDTVAYDVTYRNGVEENKVETSRITTAPVSEIVVFGTQKTQIQSLLENENVVSFEVINQPDNTLPVGQREVIQEGMNGYDEVAYDITYINENEASRVEVNRTKNYPITEIVRVGTQVTEVKRITVTENVVPYKDRGDEENSVPKDEEQIIQPGTDGYDTVSYDVTCINGIEASRIEIDRITTAPIEEVIVESPPVMDSHKETSRENTVTFQTIIQEDNTLAMGQRIIIQVGVTGYDEVTYDVTYSDGVEVNRNETERITTESVSEIVRVGTQTVDIKSETLIENTVAFETIIQEDDTLPIGERKVIQKGTDGFDTVTYEIASRDGVETGRTEVDRIHTAPVSEIIVVGTQLNETKTETVIENIISYETMTHENNTIPAGQSVVVQEGANGYDEVTYAVTYVNGVETVRTEINRKTSEAINRIVNNGVKSSDPVIFTLNKEHFVSTDSYYTLSDKLTSLEGTLTNENFVSEINYKLFDINKNELMRRTVDINENWRLSDVGFVLGLNHLEFEIILKDNSKISDSMMVLNVNEDNMDGLSLDEEDDDGDGLNNYLESINHTNVLEADSDKDGISDYDELTVTYTDPNEAYSVSSLTRDGELDTDLDGLSNSQELLFGSDYDYYDTDLDGLSDKEESDYGTSPILFDTDHDGLSDYYEVEFNLNPLVADSDQDGIIDANEIVTYAFVSQNENLPMMELTAEADVLTTFKMTEMEENDLLNDSIPGYLGKMMDFSLEGEFEKAVGTFDLNNLNSQYSLLNPKLYYYNHETQLLEEVKNQIYTDNNHLIVELAHFSDYVLLNKAEFEKVWVDSGISEEVKRLNNASEGLDVTLIIDSSGSMEWNDPSNLRQDIAIDFIKNNLSEKDKVSVIDLDWYSSRVTAFYDSFAESIEAIENIDSYGGTHIYKAIIVAVKNYSSNDENRSKVIVMLTDGKQATESWAEMFYSRADMYEHVETAIDHGISIYTIGLGDEADTAQFDAPLLQELADKTGGKYIHVSEAEGISAAFDTISEETARGADQDGDGLSNFEELNLRLGNGTYLLTDPVHADSDGDGLLDGEEVRYTKTIDEAGNVRYYYTLISNPWLTDSDLDGTNDYEERENGTNPLEKDFYVSDEMGNNKDGYQDLISNEKFESGEYYDLYIGEGSAKLKSWITRIGLYAGNALDSKIDYRTMYQNIMLEYMVEASKNQDVMYPNYGEDVTELLESEELMAKQLVDDMKRQNSFYATLQTIVASLEEESAESDVEYSEEMTMYREIVKAVEETKESQEMTDLVRLKNILDIPLQMLSYKGLISVSDTDELLGAVLDILKDPNQRSNFFSSLEKSLAEKAVDFSAVDLNDLGEFEWNHVNSAALMEHLDLSNLSEVDLTKVDWKKVGLENIDWSSVDLSKVDLSNIDFSDISNVDFSRMKVSKNVADQIATGIESVLSDKFDDIAESIQGKFKSLTNVKMDLFARALTLFDIATAISEVKETIVKVEDSYDYLTDNQSILATIYDFKKNAETNDEKTLAQAANELATILETDNKNNLYKMITVNKIEEVVTSFLKDAASTIVGSVFPALELVDTIASVGDLIFDFSGTAESLTKVFAMGTTADALAEASEKVKNNHEGDLLNLVYHLFEARLIGDQTYLEKENKDNLLEQAWYLLPISEEQEEQDDLDEIESQNELDEQFEGIAEEIFG